MIIRNVIFFKQTQIKANPKTMGEKNTFPFLERKKTEKIQFISLECASDLFADL